jgi:hypothetical protein
MSVTTQFTTNVWIRIISVTGRGSNQPGRPTRHSAAGFMWVFNSPAPRMDFADRRCQTCLGCRRPVCRAEAHGIADRGADHRPPLSRRCLPRSSRGHRGTRGSSDADRSGATERDQIKLKGEAMHCGLEPAAPGAVYAANIFHPGRRQMEEPNLPRHILELAERRWAAVLSHQAALRPAGNLGTTRQPFCRTPQGGRPNASQPNQIPSGRTGTGCSELP